MRNGWIAIFISSTCFPWTAETTIAYAALRVALKKVGGPIPANVACIAALAMEHRLPVLSRDTHFDAVPGLQRTDW
jgi:tRNA(fMet)-specific endonuclease VapC